MTSFSRLDQSFLAQWWWTVDRILLLLIAILMIFGVVMVVTASPPVALRIDLGAYHFVVRHVVFLAVSVVLMLGISFLSPRMVWRLSLIGLALGYGALVYVLLFGMEIKGAQRWIHLPGFSLQPSEFMKSFFIVVIAWFLSIKKDRPDFPAIKIVSMLFIILVGLLFLQPDMGTTAIVIFSFLVVIFVAGLPLRVVAFLGLGAIVFFIVIYFTFPHFQSRIDRFLNPESGDTFQIEKSLQAFQQGGIFGTGPGQGTVKLKLPDAHSDFIFSVAGEELGLIFTVMIVLIYGVIILRGFKNIMDNNDFFIVLAVSGILAMIGIQAMVHIGSALSLLPTKGMTLPFISYGGSSLLSSSLAMGIVMALSRKQGRRHIFSRRRTGQSQTKSLAMNQAKISSE